MSQFLYTYIDVLDGPQLRHSSLFHCNPAWLSSGTAIHSVEQPKRLRSVKRGKGSHKKDTYYIAFHSGQSHWSHHIQSFAVFSYIMKNVVGVLLAEQYGELTGYVRSESKAQRYPGPPGATPSEFVLPVVICLVLNESLGACLHGWGEKKKNLLWKQYPQQPSGCNYGLMTLVARVVGDTLPIIDGRVDSSNTCARPDKCLALSTAIDKIVTVVQVLFNEEGGEDVASVYD
ncbi:hypothetical protein BDK51DRAFT_31124 [Blyttiomyces helicus]|uniref:Uncharacterized protein n=1 Tax=Blyttiomyces helicus TaxID=388810 RepID=A0A4P9WKS4_9FUNG|nr:hypothetical protein BDK51DRAFT_31124 [Blyttiomyces helicus]|eukprot:RKO91216.1 hypothetical protein BDK51DRAFT_31124 [Blyttiomyces helicus]